MVFIGFQCLRFQCNVIRGELVSVISLLLIIPFINIKQPLSTLKHFALNSSSGIEGEHYCCSNSHRLFEYFGFCLCIS